MWPLQPLQNSYNFILYYLNGWLLVLMTCPNSFVYSQKGRGKNWNWWPQGGIQEGPRQREEPRGEAGGRGRAWVTPMCGSFYCRFLSPSRASQHNLKVPMDVSASYASMLKCRQDNVSFIFQLNGEYVWSNREAVESASPMWPRSRCTILESWNLNAKPAEEKYVR